TSPPLLLLLQRLGHATEPVASEVRDQLTPPSLLRALTIDAWRLASYSVQTKFKLPSCATTNALASRSAGTAESLTSTSEPNAVEPGTALVRYTSDEVASLATPSVAK